MSTLAEHYRRKATECATLAATMVDLVNRKQLEEVARQWLQMAEDAEVLDKIDSFHPISHSR